MARATPNECALCAICCEIESDVRLKQYFHANGVFALLACRGCIDAVDYICNEACRDLGLVAPRGVVAARVAPILRRMIGDGEILARSEAS